MIEDRGNQSTRKIECIYSIRLCCDLDAFKTYACTVMHFNKFAGHYFGSGNRNLKKIY